MLVHSAVHVKGRCSTSLCSRFTENHQYMEGHGRVQLDQVLRFDESPFELYLYYGQVHKKKESFSIKVPLTISFHILFILLYFLTNEQTN